jgi:hypothetical protein
VPHRITSTRFGLLQQHFDVPEPGLDQVGQERGQAVLPRPHLGPADARLELDAGLLFQHGVQPIGHVEQVLRTAAHKSHRLIPHLGTRNTRAGGGNDGDEPGARRAAVERLARQEHRWAHR